MDHVDAQTLKNCYDDFDTRWSAYTQIFGRLRELAVLPSWTQQQFDESTLFVDGLVSQMNADYDDITIAKVYEFVKEQRQQANWPAPRFNGKPRPTALELARNVFLFVGGLWEKATTPGLSDNPPLIEFGLLLGCRPLPDSDELRVLLSDEHTLVRRALKASALPPVEHDVPATVAPSHQQKLKSRDKQIKLLCKTHKLAGKWVELTQWANDDPIIKQLGLKPVTKHIARNVMISPQRRLKK